MNAAPAENRFATGAWIFLRLLALIHVVAFASFWVQLEPLVGANGLLPAADYFAAVKKQLGASAYHELPTLAWVFGAESFLHVLCAAGIVLGGLAFAGLAPALCLALLWVAFLSLCCAGQMFFNFQWDALLLETTLLAIFLAPRGWRLVEPPRLPRLLLWWLLFRLMFLSGVVKLASGDALWRSFDALTVHYETQPLPTVLGWYVHQLPAAWHRAACVAMFVIELVAPFLLFAPRGLRHNGALLLTGLMIAVALTGNYTYFNLLTVALCLLCFDDAWWRTVLRRPSLAESAAASSPTPPRGWRRVAGVSAASFVFAYTLVQTLAPFTARLGPPPGYRTLAALLGPLRSFNNYGLFAVMTNPRYELVFEGSTDGRTWLAYEFPHKPGGLDRAPTWVAPHQPRLDWQLWFAALGSPTQNRWVLAVCEHLLRGNPTVLRLFAHNPFAAGPPRFVRVVRYEYHFTDTATRKHTGQWWRRSPHDLYIQPASLRP